MIYICIPAYNEEQTVGVVLWKVRQVMAELDRDYQLLVTDDGSTDRTPSVLEPYTRVLPLTVYRTETRNGYAAALELLLREAVRRSEYPRRDVIIVLQADFTEDPQHVATLIKRIESGADIVASNTLYAGLKPPRAYRWGRSALNRLLRRFSWPADVRDPLAGLNAYRVATVKRAFEERPSERLLCHEGWAANADLLRAAAVHARRVDVVELEHRRERLQRDERFHFMSALREVLAMVRGRATATLTVEQLKADFVQGGRSLRTLVAESLRDSSLSNGAAADNEVARRKRRTGTGRGGGARRRRSATGPAQQPVTQAVGEAGSREAAGGEEVQKSRRRRKRSRVRGERPQPMAQDAADSGTSETTVAAAPAEVPVVETDSSTAAGAPSGQKRRRRRGSRGGRRRRRGGSADRPQNDHESNGPAPSDVPGAE